MRIKQNLKGLALVLAAGSACVSSQPSTPIPDGIPRPSTSYIGRSMDEFYEKNNFEQVMDSSTARIPRESNVLMPSGDTVTARILEVYAARMEGGRKRIFDMFREIFSTFPSVEKEKEEQLRSGLLRLYFDGEVDIFQYHMCDSISPIPEGWSEINLP